MDNNTDIKAIFKDALNQTISNYTDKPRLEISELILNICGQFRPYMIVTEAGASALSDEIFLSDTKRDFIFNLLFNFCPRLSFNNPAEEFIKLVRCLTFALSINEVVLGDNRRSANVLPEEINTRLPNHDSILTLLGSNKWLVVTLMISLFITVEDFAVDVKENPTKQ